MSTAGKVLVVLVLLAALGWFALASGVNQLNRNGNEALAKLSDQLEKVEADLEKAKVDVVQLRTQTITVQEGVDRDLGVLQARLVGLKATGSKLIENVARLQLQLNTVEATIQRGQESARNRTRELDDEKKAMAALRTEVHGLESHNEELLNQLLALRGRFQATHHANLEMIHKGQ